MVFAGVGVFPISQVLCRCKNQPGASVRFLYRVSHRDSAGRVDGDVLASASWRQSGGVYLRQWIYDQADEHFSKHFNPENREPTMFLSTTDCLLRVLNIASRWRHVEDYEDITIFVIDLGAPNSDARARFFDTHNITHAEEIVKNLGREEAYKYQTEWLFLGRIKRTAVMKQIHYQDLVDHGLYTIFPSLATSSGLRVLKQLIVMEFKVPDPNESGLSQWTTDDNHPAGWWKPLWNASTEAGKADGRKCAQFAALFDLRLPDESHLANGLMDAARGWKRSVFFPDVNYEKAFQDIASLYLPY